MHRVTVEDYVKQFSLEEVKPEAYRDIKYFYLSELEECPYIGIERTDGTVWVYGAKTDCRVAGVDDLEWYLNQV